MLHLVFLRMFRRKKRRDGELMIGMSLINHQVEVLEYLQRQVLELKNNQEMKVGQAWVQTMQALVF